MAKRMDDQKRLLWAKRLERFRVGGLSASRFCQRENVAVHSFYYWSRRLRSVDSDASSAAQRDVVVPAVSRRNRMRPSTLRARDVAAENISTQIHIRLGTHAQVSIPVECLAALRCVMSCLRDSGAERQEAFQHVFVGTR
jgi:hypothetical protein